VHVIINNVVVVVVVVTVNSQKQILRVRLPYYGTNNCKPTEPYLTTNRTL
jgi:hypothetical protein